MEWRLPSGVLNELDSFGNAETLADLAERKGGDGT
jgi:hypothetical protein